MASLFMLSKRDSSSHLAQWFIFAGRGRASPTLSATLPLRPSSLRPNTIRCGEGNPVHHKGVDISRSPCSINLRIPKVARGGGVFRARSCRGLACPSLRGRSCNYCSDRSRLNGHGRSGQKLCKSHSTSLERHLSWRFVYLAS